MRPRPVSVRKPEVDLAGSAAFEVGIGRSIDAGDERRLWVKATQPRCPASWSHSVSGVVGPKCASCRSTRTPIAARTSGISRPRSRSVKKTRSGGGFEEDGLFDFGIGQTVVGANGLEGLASVQALGDGAR